MRGLTLDIAVSIHAPNEGSDLLTARIETAEKVSIHAPNEGSDLRRMRGRPRYYRFNPRSQ